MKGLKQAKAIVDIVYSTDTFCKIFVYGRDVTQLGNETR